MFTTRYQTLTTLKIQPQVIYMQKVTLISRQQKNNQKILLKIQALMIMDIL